MSRPRLTLMVGLPASGKSTVAGGMEGVVVCPDDIRMEIFNTEFDDKVEHMVWFLAKSMVRMLLKDGHDVVIDATNVAPFRRKPWIELGREYGAWVNAVWVDTTFTECVQRDVLRDRHVPEEVFDRMVEEFEEPTMEEGFDLVSVLRD